MIPRFLIIGQGLAGTALAWSLHQCGVGFLIVDRDEELTSSKVAAGLVTPITGMRLNLNWRYDTLYPEAIYFYRGIEQRLQARFYHEVPIIRLLRDEKAAALWEKRRMQPEVQPYLCKVEGPLVDDAVFDNPQGGFQQQHSGWLDTAAFLKASRDYFEKLGCWQAGEVSWQDLELKDGGVCWQGTFYTSALFCTGWEAARHPWFDWVPFRSARGTVLNVEADTGGESRIINRGCWLLPRADGSLRVGPTYELDFEDPHVPSPVALAGLEQKLRALLKRDFLVKGSQTGVRPIIQGHQALIGRHPARPQIGFMNGLGSKGVLRAPWVARQLVAHLLEGAEIEAGLDLAGN
ncbi:glycine/D-amino acid oxidase-like deaminating enzyme [Prosthecobacter fusiformis]|uniref:Glycine/D-amino acid oxidase-like deaminating enzyme n=1 Tax=Prosthecobacter fusiformis TaxID=48464 RepID=A0A4R7RZM7_9BACT|nr:FAD-dependent oxidoreductase [Prosthecobacter fusiformis]TDU71321.1 glycine/D-amino acid oxidase-like deaminating enzyme [Prosthecobacter fusiformis]